MATGTRLTAVRGERGGDWVKEDGGCSQGHGCLTHRLGQQGGDGQREGRRDGRRWARGEHGDKYNSVDNKNKGEESDVNAGRPVFCYDSVASGQGAEA